MPVSSSTVFGKAILQGTEANSLSEPGNRWGRRVHFPYGANSAADTERDNADFELVLPVDKQGYSGVTAHWRTKRAHSHVSVATSLKEAVTELENTYIYYCLFDCMSRVLLTGSRQDPLSSIANGRNLYDYVTDGDVEARTRVERDHKRYNTVNVAADAPLRPPYSRGTPPDNIV
ncbi:hypothetical protein J6590_041165 [Homalodisca vitripennis]|nr:hypothetical protein J6590_041165 [Homalodisca vitripennis]